MNIIYNWCIRWCVICGLFTCIFSCGGEDVLHKIIAWVYVLFFQSVLCVY